MIYLLEQLTQEEIDYVVKETESNYKFMNACRVEADFRLQEELSESKFSKEKWDELYVKIEAREKEDLKQFRKLITSGKLVDSKVIDNKKHYKVVHNIYQIGSRFYRILEFNIPSHSQMMLSDCISDYSFIQHSYYEVTRMFREEVKVYTYKEM